MMRIKFFFLVISLFSYGAYSEGQPAFVTATDSTTVTGKVEGYSIKQQPQSISCYVYNLKGDRYKFSAPLQQDGKFRIRFLQQYESEFDLQYGSSFIKLYAQPGETIHLKIDHDVADKVYNFPGAYKIEGRSAAISTHMLKFFEQYLPQAQERTAGMDLKLSPAQFMELAHRNLQADLAVLAAYSHKNHPPAIFNAWMENFITYEAANWMLLKLFLFPDAKGPTDTEIKNYLANTKINNVAALHNANYYAFLARWVEGIHMALGTGRDRAELTVGALEVLDIIDTTLSGLPREIAYYNSYSWDASSELATFRLEQIWQRFDTVISNPQVQAALEEKRNSELHSFAPVDIGERIRRLARDSSTGNYLLSILEKEKGNFVYVDFWGNWCAPCMAEMPRYPSFIAQFKDEPIHFLFLSVRTPDSASKAVQQKFSIPGIFIGLDKKTTDLANQVFGFNTYPSSFLIDPDGNIVTNNIRVLNRKDATDMIRMMMKKAKAR